MRSAVECHYINILRIECFSAVENILLGVKLSEYHTGYRAFSREALECLPLEENSDDFVFDNQILAQAVAFGYRIGEISCPTRYFPEASSINFRRSVIYGLGVLATAIQFRLHRLGFLPSRLFEAKKGQYPYRVAPAHVAHQGAKGC